jgi:hypothetical protein
MEHAVSVRVPLALVAALACGSAASAAATIRSTTLPLIATYSGTLSEIRGELPLFGGDFDDNPFLGRQAEITFVYRVPPVGEAGRRIESEEFGTVREITDTIEVDPEAGVPSPFLAASMSVGNHVIRVRPDLGGIRSTAIIWDDGRQENALRHAAASFDCDVVGCFVDVLSGGYEWEGRRPLLGLDEPFFGPGAGALFSWGSFSVFRCLFDDEDCVVASSAYAEFSPASVRIAVIPLPATLPLLGAGLAAAWALGWRRRRAWPRGGAREHTDTGGDPVRAQAKRPRRAAGTPWA